MSRGSLSGRRKDLPYVHAALFASKSRVQRLFPQLLESLLSNSGIFVPENVSITNDDGTRVIPFGPSQLAQLVSEWESTTMPSIWHLRRRDPMVDVAYTNERPYLNAPPFDSVTVDIQRNYLIDSGKLDSFLTGVKKLYQVLSASYGYVKTHGMGARYDK